MSFACRCRFAMIGFARADERQSWRCNFDRTANIATATCRRMRWRPASAAMNARSARLRRDQARQCLPELRRRFCAAADPARQGVAAGRISRETAAVRQARPSEVRPRRDRRALRPHPRHCAAGSIVIPHRHCERSEAIHLTTRTERWIASSLALLAMTGEAAGVNAPAGWCPRLRRTRRGSRRPGTSRA